MRMRGLLNLLFMFGPMIYRQIQKRQRNKQRDQYRQPQKRQHLPQERPGDYIEHEEVKPKFIEPDDPNDKLTEDDIMLDKSDLRHFDTNSNTRSKEATESVDVDLEKENIEKSDLDLKDFFLD